MLIDGIKINTSPTDFKPIEDERLIRFDGKNGTLWLIRPLCPIPVCPRDREQAIEWKDSKPAGLFPRRSAC